MKKMNRERGSVGSLIVLLLFIVGGWVGFVIGKLYFQHNALRADVVELSNQILGSQVHEPKERFAQVLRSYEAEFDPEALVVEELGPKKIRLAASYQRKADLVVTQIPFQFSVDITSEDGIISGTRKSINNSMNLGNQKLNDSMKESLEHTETEPETARQH